MCLLAALGGAACDDPISPEELEGSYSLLSVGGHAPPVLEWSGATGRGQESHYVLSESLDIEDGLATVTGRVEVRVAGSVIETYQRTTQYSLQREDDHFVMVYICPPYALCTAAYIAYSLYREGPHDLRIERVDAPRRYSRV